MISFELYKQISSDLSRLYLEGWSPGQCQFFIFKSLGNDTSTPAPIVDFIFNKQNMTSQEINFFENLIISRNNYEKISNRKKKKKELKKIEKQFKSYFNSKIESQFKKK